MKIHPVVTEADRARGWAGLVIEFTDGTKESVRVHALNEPDLRSLAKLSPTDALLEATAKALRADKHFVGRLSPDDLCAVVGIVALLNPSGDVQGGAIVHQAAQFAFLIHRQAVSAVVSKFPKISPELREQLNLMRNHGESIRALLPKRELPAM